MSEGVCPHPVLFEQICVECGSRVDSTGYKQLADGTWVLPKQAEQLNGRLEGQLRHRKQLALVVDLDKTLIDTATVRDDDEAQRIISEDEEHRSDFLNLFAREHYLIRLRPHVREFLAKIEPLFYMQLYTLSERSYASEIIKFIDPQGTFFHGRILCRDDDAIRGLKDRKSVTTLFPASDKMAVVLDDTPGVWSDESGMIYANLIQLAPFKYFKPRTMRAPPGPRVIQSGIEDQALLRMGDVLEELHRRYYEENNTHVKLVLNDMRDRVFAGCYIYFDPNLWERFSQGSEGMQRYFESRTEEFGGIVLNAKSGSDFLSYCTHVVTNMAETTAVAQAMDYNGIHIVTRDWVEESFLNFLRFDESEERFRVPGAPAITTGTRERTEPPQWGDLVDRLWEQINEEEDSSGVYSDNIHTDGDSTDEDGEAIDMAHFFSDESE